MILVGEFRNWMEPPNTESGKLKNKHVKVLESLGTKNVKPDFSSKVVTPLYVPSDPFYRETKGLLHSKLPLRSKEYSKWEHVHECHLHPVIHEANFRYLQACHLFTPRTQTFDTAPLTQLIRSFCLLFVTIFKRTDSRLELPKSSPK
jgi:hypothetical protein